MGSRVWCFGCQNGRVDFCWRPCGRAVPVVHLRLECWGPTFDEFPFNQRFDTFILSFSTVTPLSWEEVSISKIFRMWLASSARVCSSTYFMFVHSSCWWVWRVSLKRAFVCVSELFC